MRYCGHFLIKAEGGAKNYKHDHLLPLAWRSFTVAFVQQKGYKAKPKGRGPTSEEMLLDHAIRSSVAISKLQLGRCK